MEQKEQKRIIWIDDDVKRASLRPYLDELFENGFDIEKVKNPDLIDSAFSNCPDFVAIIIDVLMPTGNSIGFKEANGGLWTGLIVLKRLLEDPRTSNKPLIVFTIVNDIVVKEYCKKRGIPFLNKKDYNCSSFVDKIKELINNHKTTVES